MKREGKSPRRPRGGPKAPVAEAAPKAEAAPTPAWTWFLPPLLAAVLYAVTLANGFVLDDGPLILDDPRMGSLGEFFHLGGTELVVRYWSLLLDSAIWGTRPLGFHLTNVLLHAACGVALFAYLRRLLSMTGSGAKTAGAGRAAGKVAGLAWTDAAALGAALLFVAHPMQTESVAGVTHRKEMLATTFLLLALWRSLGPSRGWGRALEVGVYMALAIFAKAPAAVFFPLVLLQDLWVRRRSVSEWIRRDAAFYLPAASVLAGYLAYRWAGITLAINDPVHFEAYNPQAAGLETGDRLLTSVKVLGLYWRLILVPWRPTLERHVEAVRGGSDPLAFLVLLTVAVILFAAWRVSRRRPVLALGLAWLVVAPLPTLNILPANFLFSERYLYLPSVGLALVLAALFAAAAWRFRAPGRMLAGVVIGLLVLMSPLVIARNLEWRNTSTLLAASVRDNPGSPRIAYFHAMDLRTAGRLEESQAEVLRALRIQPRFPDAWHLAGRNHADLGRPGEALEAYERAVDQSRSPDPAWLNDYAVALIQAGRRGEALPLLTLAMKHDPDAARYRDNYLQLLLLDPATRARGLEEVELTTREDPQRTLAWVLLLEAQLASADTAAATATVARARSVVRDPNLTRFLQARLNEARGDRAGAAAAYREILATPGLEESDRSRMQKALDRASRP